MSIDFKSPTEFVPPSMRPRPRQVVIEAARAILDPEEGAVDNARLTIEDGVLVRVETGVSFDQGPESRQQGQEEGQEERYRLDDGYLIPGLIEAHCHLIYPGQARGGNLPQFSREEQLLVAADNLRLALDSGLTLVQDCGAPDTLGQSVAKMVKDGWIEGPRVLASGAPLTVTGGHCNQWGMEVDTVPEAVRAVRWLKKSGADFVKVMASGGGTPGTEPHEAYFPQDMLEAVVEEAHLWGLRVVAHTTTPESTRRCLEAGVDSLDHVAFLTSRTSYEIDPRLIERIAESGSFVCPTLTASWRGTVEMIEEDRAGLVGPDQQWRLDFRRLLVSQSMEGFEALVRAGARIAAGTDAGTGQNPIDDIALELQLMAKYGMSRKQVLTSVTKLAAEAVGMKGSLGVLKPGHLADCVLLQANPLEDIKAYEQVKAVFVGGRKLR